MSAEPDRVKLGDDDQALALLQSIAKAAVELQHQHEFPEWRLAAIRLKLGNMDSDMWALIEEAEDE